MRECEALGGEIGEPFPPLPVSILRAEVLAGVSAAKKTKPRILYENPGQFAVTPTGLEAFRLGRAALFLGGFRR